MSRKSRLGFLLSCLAFAGLTVGCVDILTLEPQTAENPVGTTHTVTGTFLDDECVIPIVCGPFPFAAVPTDNFFFEIVEGPNAGLVSDGDCGPARNDPCFIEEEGSLTWTYRGSGGPGTDLIQFCPRFTESIEESKAYLASAIAVLAEDAGVSKEEFMEIMNGNEAAPAQVDPGCVGATKVWVGRDREERSQPNIGAGLSGLFAGQPTPLPTAAAPAPAPAALNQGIRPPNTGDAGLR
jgi:hypothetical protein